jgi:F0F1-type ATP synthase assembly protein I
VKQLGAFGLALQLGWVVALATLIPLGLGVWLDRQFGTAPLFILIGALVGIGASTVAAVRIVVRNIETLGKNETAPSAGGKEDRA